MTRDLGIETFLRGIGSAFLGGRFGGSDHDSE
jgi:hypothetical protein